MTDGRSQRTMRRWWGHPLLSLVLLASLVALVGTSPASAGPPPAGFIVEPVATGLFLPTAVAFAPGNRMYIAQKGGVVRVWRDGALLPAPFIDLSAEVNDVFDRGLLGIAVHPEFPVRPYVYLLYTYDPPGVQPDVANARVSRLMRVEVDPANPEVAPADPAKRVILLGTNSTLANIGNPNTFDGPPSCQQGSIYVRDCIPVEHLTHTIGTVLFAPDGSLWVSSGEGASAEYVDARALRSQDLDSLSGKILRIDPLTGEGMADNPFFNGDPNSNRSKVVNYGLRNPFRFTLHPVTGEYYGGDVGWFTWEEINTGKGKNFGWPCYEGDATGSAVQPGYAYGETTISRCQTLLVQGPGAVQAPLWSYNHDGGGASAQVGSFYMGSTYPAQYRGALFIADYNRDWIKTLTVGPNGEAVVADFIAGAEGPVQIVAAPDSNLYYVSINTGEIRRIRYAGGANSPPVARILANPTEGAAPLQVGLSGADSTDADGGQLTYSWNFGDGTNAAGMAQQHVYGANGVYNAILTVTDPSGQSDSESVQIVVGNLRPQLSLVAPAVGTTYKIGDSISYSATATDPQQGNLTGAISWRLNLHHFEHTHFDAGRSVGGTGSYVAQDHGDNTYYELCASITDNTGLTAEVCRDQTPQLVTLSFTTVPAGLPVIYGGAQKTTPFSVTAIKGSAHEVTALPTQGSQEFASWSDGGARTHNINVGLADASFVATYREIPGALVFQRAVNLAGPAVIIDGQAWEAAAGAPKFEAGPFLRCDHLLAFTPATDVPRNQMIKCFAWGNAAAPVRVAFTGLAANNYAVYAYVNKSTAAPFDLALNGTVVASNLLPGAVGAWQRVGPFPVTPDATGAIVLTGSGTGEQNISGVELFRVSGGGNVGSSVSLTTAGNTPPTVTTANPAAGTVGHGRNANLTVNFSEPIQGHSTAVAVLTRVSNGNTVVATVTLDGTGQILTINPVGRLRANILYRLTLTGGPAAIRDLAGQPLVTTSLTFTTGAA